MEPMNKYITVGRSQAGDLQIQYGGKKINNSIKNLEKIQEIISERPATPNTSAIKKPSQVNLPDKELFEVLNEVLFDLATYTGISDLSNAALEILTTLDEKKPKDCLKNVSIQLSNFSNKTQIATSLLKYPITGNDPLFFKSLLETFVESTESPFSTDEKHKILLNLLEIGIEQNKPNFVELLLDSKIAASISHDEISRLLSIAREDISPTIKNALETLDLKKIATEIKKNFESSYKKCSWLYLKLFGGERKKAQIENLYAEISGDSLSGVSSEVSLLINVLSKRDLTGKTFSFSLKMFNEKTTIPDIIGFTSKDLNVFLENALSDNLKLSKIPNRELLQLLCVIQNENIPCPNLLKQLEKHCAGKFQESLDKNLACSLLSEASSLGKVALMQCLIKLGSPVDNLNAKEFKRTTPLIKAVSHGQVEAVKLLIKSGANTLLPNSDYVTPMHIAKNTKIKHSEEIILLLEKASKSNSSKEPLLSEIRHLCTLLHTEKNKELLKRLHSFSIKENHNELINEIAPGTYEKLLLLEILQPKSKEFPKLLNLLIREKIQEPLTVIQLPDFKKLLEKVLNSDQFEIGLYICKKLCPSTAEFAEAKLTLLNTRLITACSLGAFEKAKQLIRLGAKLDTKNSLDKTPLEIVIESNHKNALEFVQFIFSYSADNQESLNLVEPRFHPEHQQKAIQTLITQIVKIPKLPTSIEAFIQKKQKELFDSIKEKTVEKGIYSLDDFIQNQIIEIVLSGNIGIMEKFLERNPDPKIKNDALMIACLMGELTVAEFLIHEGALLNTTNKDGYTPLLLAIDYPHVKSLELIKLMFSYAKEHPESLGLKKNATEASVIKALLSQEKKQTTINQKETRDAILLAFLNGNRKIEEFLSNERKIQQYLEDDNAI